MKIQQQKSLLQLYRNITSVFSYNTLIFASKLPLFLASTAVQAIRHYQLTAKLATNLIFSDARGRKAFMLNMIKDKSQHEEIKKAYKDFQPIFKTFGIDLEHSLFDTLLSFISDMPSIKNPDTKASAADIIPLLTYIRDNQNQNSIHILRNFISSLEFLDGIGGLDIKTASLISEFLKDEQNAVDIINLYISYHNEEDPKTKIYLKENMIYQIYLLAVTNEEFLKAWTADKDNIISLLKLLSFSDAEIAFMMPAVSEILEKAWSNTELLNNIQVFLVPDAVYKNADKEEKKKFFARKILARNQILSYIISIAINKIDFDQKNKECIENILKFYFENIRGEKDCKISAFLASAVTLNPNDTGLLLLNLKSIQEQQKVGIPLMKAVLEFINTANIMQYIGDISAYIFTNIIPLEEDVRSNIIQIVTTHENTSRLFGIITLLKKAYAGNGSAIQELHTNIIAFLNVLKEQNLLMPVIIASLKSEYEISDNTLAAITKILDGQKESDVISQIIASVISGRQIYVSNIQPLLAPFIQMLQKDEQIRREIVELLSDITGLSEDTLSSAISAITAVHNGAEYVATISYTATTALSNAACRLYSGATTAACAINNAASYLNPFRYISYDNTESMTRD